MNTLGPDQERRRIGRSGQGGGLNCLEKLSAERCSSRAADPANKNPRKSLAPRASAAYQHVMRIDARGHKQEIECEPSPLFLTFTTVNSSHSKKAHTASKRVNGMAIAKNPTETSPLLGSQRNGDAIIDPASTGAICNSDPEAPCPVGGAGTTPNDGADDHRNKLRYIIPAISIGVCTQSALPGPPLSAAN